MSTYRAAVIGCGRPSTAPVGVAEGHAIAYAHGRGYAAAAAARIVAAADIDATNLAAFVRTFDVPATYADYRQLLERERPDLVSVCTWPSLHPEMVIAAAEAGAKGVLCEKPMALGLGEVDRMLEACARSGTVLCINHQRRLVPPWTTAKAWLQEGWIGALRRIEAWIGGGWDLLSWGTHWVDMCFFMTGDRPAQWVIAQVDCTGRQRRYAHPVEDRSLTMVGFDGGVTGLLHIAPEAPAGAGIRLVGTDGLIEVAEGGEPHLVSGRAAPRPEPESRGNGFAAAVQDLIQSVETGQEPHLSGAHGRRATEVLMAAYASGVEGRLVPLPYQHPEFPLLARFGTPTGAPAS